jgi:hypothetical protein
MRSAKSVELEGNFYHVRFNDPDRYDTIRTPEWADRVSDSVSEGSEVRMGKLEDSDDWEVQSVLIKKEAGEEKAREQAEKIVEKINS